MSLGVPMRRPMIALSAFKSIEENQTLFDFDTFINEDNFVINSTSHIYRSRKDEYIRGKKLQVVTKENAMNGDVPNFDFEMLFSVNVKEEDQKISYVIGKPENIRQQLKLKSQILENMPYVCLNGHGRTNEVKSYPITQGDIIKLGKSYLKVLQTHLSNGKVSQLPQIREETEVETILNNEDSESVAKVCRICLMEADQHEQVISPCNCKGSCKFVHLSCLKTWFQNKVTAQNNRLVTTYHLSRFECQICKTPLSNKITYKGQTQTFVQFRKPDQPYIVLQKIQTQSKDKTIFVLTPKTIGVKIGRSNIVELRINDPAMSRMHAVIQFRGGEFVLSDLGSKFGTQVLLRKQASFERIMCLQLRNKVYKLQVIPSINSRAQVYLG